MTYTLSKSMNNVGEAFFSSPIDPTDIMRDWGRSDDDQRHRLVVNGTVNTSMAPATTAWQRISHGFQVSGDAAVLLGAAVQHHLRRGQPAGDDEPAARRRRHAAANFDVRSVELIPRNAGTGSDFFALNLRASRAFRITGGVKLEGLVEAFNATNRVNNLTRNNTFGSGAIRPIRAGLQPDHGGRRSATQVTLAPG